MIPLAKSCRFIRVLGQFFTSISVSSCVDPLALSLAKCSTIIPVLNDFLWRSACKYSLALQPRGAVALATFTAQIQMDACSYAKNISYLAPSVAPFAWLHNESEIRACQAAPCPRLTFSMGMVPDGDIVFARFLAWAWWYCIPTSLRIRRFPSVPPFRSAAKCWQKDILWNVSLNSPYTSYYALCTLTSLIEFSESVLTKY